MGDQAKRHRPFWYIRRSPRDVQTDVDEELNLHLEMRAAELRAQGMPSDEARREAVRQFGDVEHTRAYCREQNQAKEHDVQRGLMLEDLAQDLRICLRGLIRAPIMTLTIIATVGLGIGATTAIFSAVNAALLQPLPYPNADRLVRIYTDSAPNRFPFSVADYLALTAQQTRFEQIAGYQTRPVSFSDGAQAERLRGRVVSWTYFGVVGIKPAIGRDFAEADGQPGSPSRVIVSHGFWQRRLGSRTDVVGSHIRLDGADFEVVGVLPEQVGSLEQNQETFIAATWATPPRKGPFFITAIGRLPSGGSRAAAAEELRAINRRIFPIWRVSYQDEKATWSLMDLKTFVVGDVGPVGGLALGAVALVWLIACANASNLLIARVTSRRRELAVRAALGASRGRVVRYLLAESSLLALGAATVGIALTWVSMRLLRDVGASFFPRMTEIAMTGPVLGLLVALTAASGLLFGLIPAIHGTGGPVDNSLRATGRTSTGTVSVRRLRRLLVGSQFAIATPLLIVAGLLLVSLTELGRVALGFDTHNLLSGSLTLPAAQYTDAAHVSAFWDELQRRVEALPRVSGTTYSDGRPPTEVGNFNNFDLEDFPAAPGESQPVTPWLAVTPEYFRVVGLSLLQGRTFDNRDAQAADTGPVVVDRAWASRFFPNTSALGKRFRNGGCTTCAWNVVVGIVSPVKYAGIDKPDEGTVYTPLPARGTTPPPNPIVRSRFLIVRTGGNPETLAPLLQQVVRDVDPSLPLSNVATIDDLVARSLQRPRSLSLLVAVFASVALLLSMIGIYGVMAYYVQQHAKDIGIRLALGGSPGNLLRLIVGQGMTVVTSGVGVGVLAALGVARLMSSLLFGVGAADALTFVGVSALLLTVALVACFLPARRAVGMQPSMVLRDE